jgi:hypothetical protein
VARAKARFVGGEGILIRAILDGSRHVMCPCLVPLCDRILLGLRMRFAVGTGDADLLARYLLDFPHLVSSLAEPSARNALVLAVQMVRCCRGVGGGCASPTHRAACGSIPNPQ